MFEEFKKMSHNLDKQKRIEEIESERVALLQRIEQINRENALRSAEIRQRIEREIDHENAERNAEKDRLQIQLNQLDKEKIACNKNLESGQMRGAIQPISSIRANVGLPRQCYIQSSSQPAPNMQQYIPPVHKQQQMMTSIASNPNPARTPNVDVPLFVPHQDFDFHQLCATALTGYEGYENIQPNTPQLQQGQQVMPPQPVQLIQQQPVHQQPQQYPMISQKQIPILQHQPVYPQPQQYQMMPQQPIQMLQQDLVHHQTQQYPMIQQVQLLQQQPTQPIGINNIPTIVRNINFNVGGAADSLYSILRSNNCSKTEILKKVVGGNIAQRNEVCNIYYRKYNENLFNVIDQLKHKDDEESEIFKILIRGLFNPPSSFAAYMLHHYLIEGFGVETSRLIIEILITRSSLQISEISNAYTTLYQCNLYKDISNYKCANHIKKIITALLNNNKNEVAIDQEKAEIDALNLFRSTGDEKFNKFIEFISNQNKAQLSILFYKYNNFCREQISKGFGVDTATTEKCIENIIICFYNRQLYYAQILNNSFKHGNNRANVKDLIWITLSQCEVNLQIINNCYESTYNNLLQDDIQSHVQRGFYKNTIISLCNGNVQN